MTKPKPNLEAAKRADYNDAMDREFLEFVQLISKTKRRKYPDLWRNNLRIWHHNNVPAYTSMLVCDLSSKIYHNHAFLFRKLKKP